MATKKEFRFNFSSSGLMKLVRRKNPDEMIKDAKRNGLKKTLNAMDLITGIRVILFFHGIFLISILALMI